MNAWPRHASITAPPRPGRARCVEYASKRAKSSRFSKGHEFNWKRRSANELKNETFYSSIMRRKWRFVCARARSAFFLIFRRKASALCYLSFRRRSNWDGWLFTCVLANGFVKRKYSREKKSALIRHIFRSTRWIYRRSYVSLYGVYIDLDLRQSNVCSFMWSFCLSYDASIRNE